MTHVSVVFHSGTGHTARLAEAVARGASAVDFVEADLLEITPAQIGSSGRWRDESIIAKLEASDAIVFGCPTYMGSVSAVFKAFMEGAIVSFFQQGWKDKFAGGFTNSSCQSGDKLATLMQLAVYASQLSMVWVSVGEQPGNNWSGGGVGDVNRLGSYLGVMGQSNVDEGPERTPPESDLLTAQRYGLRIALITRRWKGEGTYETEHLRPPYPVPGK